MRFQPIVGAATPPSTVSGLGVSDALRLELAPGQHRWLIDHLEEIRGPLEEEMQLARARADERGSAESAERLEAIEHELQLLRVLRAQIPAFDHNEAVVFVGPTGMVLDLVRETVRDVVEELGALVAGRGVGDPSWHARLRETAEGAAAWVRTLLDCEAVELFRFEPDVDPSGRAAASVAGD